MKILKSNELYPVPTVLEFLENNGYICTVYESLSELVKTMTGDSITPFNNVKELIKTIPDIVNCGENNAFLEIDGDWFVLGFNYENDLELSNKILQTYYPDWKIID